MLAKDSVTERTEWDHRLDAVLIAHAIAHTALRNADDYLFEAPVETITVYGAAICAVGHVVMVRRRAD